MLKKIFFLVTFTVCYLEFIKSQDLNTINGTGFNIATSFTPTNAPEYTVILGIQDQYDINYKWQFLHAYNSDNYYLRRYQYGWGNYLKIWHSGNLNRSDIDFTAQNINCYYIKTSRQGIGIDGSGYGNSWGIGKDNTMGLYFYEGTANQYRMIIKDGGNVGIGTTNPGNYKLNVAGRIRADEIVVNTTGADFVFEPTYKLPTLSELEAFVKEHKHLPDIAPAKEMQENGVSMSEMQKKLLQKIEELTLYSIEQNKKLEQQNQEIIDLKKQNERIKILEEKLMRLESTSTK